MMNEERSSEIINRSRSKITESKRIRYLERNASLKVLVVGDGAIGKTCLIWAYKERTFPTEYIPTVVENYHTTIRFAGQSVNLEIFDTAGQEDYDMIRILSYPGTEIFIVCFSVAIGKSLVNVKEKWVPEIKENCPLAKMILVSTMIDLRDDEETKKKMKEEGKTFISPKRAESFAKENGFISYFETSALRQEGLKEVFLACVEEVLEPKVDEEEKLKKRNGGCVIL